MHGEINLYQSSYCNHAFCQAIWYFAYTLDTLNICIKKFDAIKILFWQNDSLFNEAIF